MAYGRETFVRKCLRSQSSERRIGALLNRRALASIFLLRRKLETDANHGLAGRQGTGRRYLTTRMPFVKASRSNVVGHVPPDARQVRGMRFLCFASPIEVRLAMPLRQFSELPGSLGRSESWSAATAYS